MLTGKLLLLALAFCLLTLSVRAKEAGRAQEAARAQEAKLVPGQGIAGEIEGGGQHRYQVTLTAGQFMRVEVDQRGIDVAVALIAPDGKQLSEVNLSSGAFGLEPLSHDAVVSGNYLVVVRAIDKTAPKGAYEVRLAVKATASASDKQRMEAELKLAEAG